MTMTRELAWGGATDAGNRNAKKHGRHKWNIEDVACASAEFNRLWPPSKENDAVPQVLQFLEVPTV